MTRRRALLCACAAAVLPVTALAATAGPNDPYYPVQWALHGTPGSTDATQAWCASQGAGVLVADIDTGADFSHPDLQGRLVVGAAFTSGTSSISNPQPDATGQDAVMDDYGHGTMTTGIMVANAGNGIGITGEAPAARALVMKVFSNGTTGYGAYSSDVSAAIVWAVQHGARVINLSLGPQIPLISTKLGDTTPTWVQWAAENGASVAIAAGNNYIPAADYQKMSAYALVVGALGPSGAKASYSQFGNGVNIFAPGGDSVSGGGDPSSDVISTFPTYTLPSQNQPLTENVAPGYAAYDGTSFSTPYVAGVLAMLMAHGYSATQARQRVLATARTLNSLPVLDAAAALGPCGGGGGGSAPPGGHQSGGGSSGSAGQAANGGGAGHPQAAGTPAGGMPASPPAGQAAVTPGAGESVVPGGASAPPSQTLAPSHASLSGLLVAGLVVVILVGAPAVAALRRRLRGV